jgi:hypothetical protein
MTFQASQRFIMTKSNQDLSARPDFENRYLVAEPVDNGICFKVQEKGKVAGNHVDITLFETYWELHYRKSKNAHWLENDQKRILKIGSSRKAGLFGLAFNALWNGDLIGESACETVEMIFSFAELENLPKNEQSWVEKYFPKYFKLEQNRIDRANNKVCKEVLET